MPRHAASGIAGTPSTPSPPWPGSAASPAPRDLTGRVIDNLATLIVLILMLVSPMALAALGWNYDSIGGTPFERFHPATYLTFITFILILLRDGNPLASLITRCGRDAPLCLYLIVWLMMLLHAAINQGRPAAQFIDTFLLPALFLLILPALRPGIHARMLTIIHLAFTLNAVIGIGEFATGARLTPYVAGGVAITDDWRSTALMGHPLGNALMTGCYTTLLLLGGDRNLRSPMRLAMIGLQFMAMIAFGGRASLVLLALIGVICLIRLLLRFFAGARLPLIHLTMLACLLPLAAGGIAILVDLGFFDQFILRFVEDKGSANARIVMFELFSGFTLNEILLGPPQAQLDYLVLVYRLEFGIESLWIAFSLYYGILPSLVFFIGLLLLCFSIVARCENRVVVVLAYFFAVNTTFLGLAGKTPLFANLTLLMLLMLPRARIPAPARPKAC